MGGVGRRERVGLAFTGVLCVAGALFLRTWAVPYLALATLATLGVVASAWGARGRATWSALTVLSVGMVASAWVASRSIARPPASDAVAEDEVLNGIGAAATEVFPELQLAAARLASLPVSGALPVTLLEPVLPSAAMGEAAGVVLDGASPVAWAGVVRLPVGNMPDSIGVASNEFYDVAYARVTRGTRTGLAMRTIEARSPADRLARPWARFLALRFDLERVVVSRTPSAGATLGVAGQPLAWLTPVPVAEGLRRVRGEERSRVVVLSLIAAILLLGTGLVWRASGGLLGRLTTIAVALAVVWFAPLSALSNVSPVFDPGYYFAPGGGALTASVGALALTGALACLAVFAIVRHRAWRPPALVAIPLVAATVIGGPYLLRALARGIALPPRGVPPSLWVAWEVALFLVGVATLLLATWAAGATRRAGLPYGAAWGSAIATAAAASAPLLLDAPGRFPPWYQLLWIGAMAAVVFTRRVRRLLLHVGVVAACGAATLTWGDVTRKRVELAERDVTGLAVADAETRNLLFRLLEDVQRQAAPRTTSDLLRLYVGSDLAAAGNPVELATWSITDTTTGPSAVLMIADLARRSEGERAIARAADSTGTPILREFGSAQGVQLVLAAPLDSGHALTAVVAPRSRLIADDPFAALLGLDVPTVVEPPYMLTVGPGRVDGPGAGPHWTRRADEFHGDWQLDAVLGSLHAHVEVELRSLDVVLMRGTLLVLLDLVVLGALWLLLVASDAALLRWGRGRLAQYRRSYRARLTLAFFAAFALPSIAFAIWTRDRLEREDAVSRALLVQETLRAVPTRGVPDLAAESDRLDAPLFRYVNGALVRVSDTLYARLAPLGQFLDPVAADELVDGQEESTNRRVTVGAVPTLLGYRVLADGSVLAAPARRSELTLERQQRDVLALLVFAVLLGTLVALWLSGLAARAFASPIAALRRAAGDVAAGARELPSLGREPPTEFSQVYGTFRRMAVDLSDSRTALDSARRRTEAVLRDVASGVVAIAPDGAVVLANPQAERILGVPLPAGDRLARVGEAELPERVRTFLEGDREEDGFDLQLRGRQLRGRLTRLSRGDGGVVLTLDDITDVARAQRVFAWGEMARQVAHEIKNPLTPIRLGVQHVRRAHADQRADFGQILERNVYRILEEIDRLDEIARTFSRYGLRPDEAQAAEPVDVSAVVRDVVDLERMGESGIRWDVGGADALVAQSREGELREVLLNVLENARLAHATHVTARVVLTDGWVQLVVDDDGDGIPAEVLPRIFEPHFSTRTSGSGLGLAISKRMVESWGGRIRIDRREPRGTRVELALVPAGAP